MNYREAKKCLESFVDNERTLQHLSSQDFNLKTIKKLLALAGNFHKDLKVIHLAGSKGKGSTAAMLAAVLRESDLSVGLFTSPHINDLRERIRILSKEGKTGENKNDIFCDMISPRDFSRAVSVVNEWTAQLGPEGKKRLTFFEVCTVVALFHFWRKKTDWVILETGLGGRLDATNVVDAQVAVITTITYEHTNILGKTLARIAREKAAIIKKNTKAVVVSAQAEEALQEVNARCRRFGLIPGYADQCVKIECSCHEKGWQRIQLNYQKQKNAFENFPVKIDLSLWGDFQLKNLQTVLSVLQSLRSLGVCVSREHISRGLKNVWWPLRMEKVCSEPLIILDAAHTKISAQHLAEAIQKIYPRKKVSVILSVSADKDVSGICRALAPVAQTVYWTQFKGVRAFKAGTDFFAAIFQDTPYCLTQTFQQAFDQVLKQKQKNSLVLITGSIFLAAEARRYIINHLTEIER